MAYFLAPVGDARAQFFTNQGAVLAGGKLYAYLAGTTTPLDTFTDSTGAVPNANPIVLDSAGRPTTGIYLTEGSSYKFVLKDSAGVTLWTQDVVVGIATSAPAASEWQSSGLTPTYISATQFSVPGDQTSDLHKRRRLKVVDSGGTKYGTVTASAFTTLTTVTVEIDAGGSLANPLTSVSWSLVRADNPSVDADMVHRKSSDTVTSAATCDIWSIQGDYVHVAGATGPITSFGTAPYAGAQRTVIFDSTPTLTHNGTTLQLPGAANIVVVAGARAVVRADTTANMIVTSYVRADGKAVINTANTQPTRQVLTSGAGATYTTPANVTRLVVRMIGGGAGGAAATTNSGAVGNNTTFSTFTASGGTAGVTAGGNGGAGGAASGGTINIPGGSGQGGGANATGTTFLEGGQGGSSVFGGAGSGGNGNNAGGNAATNSGGGGGGGGGLGGGNSGGGGGSGGYVEAVVITPAATYTYTIGTGGAGGAAGGIAGGNGAAGIIVVDEFYD